MRMLNGLPWGKRWNTLLLEPCQSIQFDAPRLSSLDIGLFTD